MMIMSLLLLLNCGFFLWQPTAGNDYWSDDFDSTKNCQQEEKITKLSDEVGVHCTAHELNEDSIMLFSGKQKLFDHIAGMVRKASR